MYKFFVSFYFQDIVIFEWIQILVWWQRINNRMKWNCRCSSQDCAIFKTGLGVSSCCPCGGGCGGLRAPCWWPLIETTEGDTDWFLELTDVPLVGVQWGQFIIHHKKVKGKSLKKDEPSAQFRVWWNKSKVPDDFTIPLHCLHKSHWNTCPPAVNPVLFWWAVSSCATSVETNQGTQTERSWKWTDRKSPS